MVLIGIDLAWGDRRSDGVCVVHATRTAARVIGFAYPRGDDQLIEEIHNRLPRKGGVFLTVDAPLVVPNRTGSRPVDRLTHVLFHREHAGAHPANAERCIRPPRLLKKLRQMGFRPGWELSRGGHMVAEVYPHPALVRFLNLPRIIKYKRGPSVFRRQEFQRLQTGLRTALQRYFPSLVLNEDSRRLLKHPWTKEVEDLTDALVCMLIGLWHWKYGGKRSQILGDHSSGFILLPKELRSERTRSLSGPRSTPQVNVL